MSSGEVAALALAGSEEPRRAPVAELLVVDRALAVGRLVTAIAAASLTRPAAGWPADAVAAAAAVSAVGGLATAAATVRRRSSPSRSALARRVRLEVSADVVVASVLVVATGVGSQRVPGVGAFAFGLLPLAAAAVRYGLAGLATVWLTLVAIVATSTAASAIGGGPVSVVSTLPPLAVLGAIALPVGVLSAGLVSAIGRFESAVDTARTRSRLLGELTRLTHGLSTAATAATGPADARRLLAACVGRLGFVGVTVTSVDELGIDVAALDPGGIPTIHAAGELAGGGAVRPPVLPVDRPGFVAVARLGVDPDRQVLVAWASGDPLLPARLEALAAAVAQTRAAVAATVTSSPTPPALRPR